MQDFLSCLNTYTPVVSIFALIVLVIYTVDTARIRRAAVVQARAQLQPCIVLVGDPRAHDEQLVDTAFAPAASSEIHVPVTMTNIGVGPAHSISFQFRNVDDAKAHVWRFTLPQLPPGHSHVVPLGRAR